MKVLIVAAHFAPSAVIGAKRPTKIAEKLTQLGIETHVFTVRESCQAVVEETVSDLRKVHIHRRRCLSPWYHSRKWFRAKTFPEKLMYGTLRALNKVTEPWLYFDDLFTWVVTSTRFAARLAQDQRIDVIWATTPSISAVVLARRIAERTKIPYVADFRDVPTSAFKNELKSSKQRRLFHAMSKCAKNANGITYVAPAQKQRLEELFAIRDERKFQFCPNFFVPEVTTNPRDLKNRSIVYGGSLYRGLRRLHSFLEAMKVLNNAHPANRIRFDFFGNRQSHRRVAAVARELGITNDVTLHDLIPEAEFLNVCRESRILLLAVAREPQGGMTSHENAIPGKLYDYLKVARPILVTGPPDCAAGKIVESCLRGIAAADDDPVEIQNAILALLESRSRTGPLDLDISAVQRYTVDHVVNDLCTFLNKIVSKTKRP